jgi:hypothetical protein
MLNREMIEELLREAEGNLAGWQEPDASGVGGGTLVLTEPDAEQRALIRIRARAHIYTLQMVLEIATSDAERTNERRDHRDLQRIRDAVRDDIEAEVRA